MSRALLEALALIEAQSPAGRSETTTSMQLPSLMERCAVEAAAAADPEPVRLIHHFACTGGTLISSNLAIMPNVTLLSEIDPLSRLGLPKAGSTPPFRPHDLIFWGLVAQRPISDSEAEAVFTAGLSVLHGRLAAQGRYLILRDHAHSQFCTNTDWHARPTLASLVASVARVRAVITVRHPMDSLLSLRANNWVHYRSDTLDAYAWRYTAFLDAHEGTTITRYEDFIANPENTMERLCDTLALPFRSGTQALLSLTRMSGNSGRKGAAIEPRPRRSVPDGLISEARKNLAWQALCDRLGYKTD